MCMMYMPDAHGGRKRASDPPGTRVTDGCELRYGCWELNSGRVTPEISLVRRVQLSMKIKPCFVII